MKILHAPYSYFPDAAGGTETYVAELMRALAQRGVESIVAAPGARGETYTHGPARVRRFALPPPENVDALYGEGEPGAARAFARILDDERPDLVHLHALSPGVSLPALRKAHERGLPVVFTYHTPTATCQRGTLLRWGSEVCDGHLDASLCARCTLQGLGAPRPLAEIAGRLPAPAGAALGRVLPAGSLATAVRMRDLVSRRHAATRSFLAEIDRIVVLCAWSRDVLTVNGVPESKIVLSRHGLSLPDSASLDLPEPVPADVDPLRVAFFGRAGKEKGLDTLVRALRLVPGLPVALDVYSVSQGEGDRRYLARIQARARGDGRIRFLDPVAPELVVPRMRQYHLLAVPSLWLETGPLVVLDAFAAGLPVLGSNLGGVAELVRHGTDGLLVEAGSWRAWSDALTRVAADRSLLRDLRAGVQPPRRAEDVAHDMHVLYRPLVGRGLKGREILRGQGCIEVG